MNWRGWAWMLGAFACILVPLRLPERVRPFVQLGGIPIMFFCLRRAVPFFDAVDEARAREKAAKAAAKPVP